MVLLFENGFSGWGQFLQSFYRSTREYIISLVLLQKLCKNCPHPEKLHLPLEDDAFFASPKNWSNPSDSFERNPALSSRAFLAKSANLFSLASFSLAAIFFSS